MKTMITFEQKFKVCQWMMNGTNRAAHRQSSAGQVREAIRVDTGLVITKHAFSSCVEATSFVYNKRVRQMTSVESQKLLRDVAELVLQLATSLGVQGEAVDRITAALKAGDE